MDQVKLWSPDDPNLYHLNVELINDEGEAVEAIAERFGIRTIEVQGSKIVLNGKPIIIKGVNRYDEVDGYGPVVAEDIVRADLLKAKQAGVNCIRTHYPQDPVHLKIMDEVGLMLMEEIPLNWWLKPWELEAEADENENNEIIDRAEQVLEEMVKRDYNHPCLIACVCSCVCLHGSVLST
jgi:beta-galactosidase/beta-glucuronidase